VVEDSHRAGVDKMQYMYPWDRSRRYTQPDCDHAKSPRSSAKSSRHYCLFPGMETGASAINAPPCPSFRCDKVEVLDSGFRV
jgi:hypothetical protein